MTTCPVLFAAVEHRAWVRTVEYCLREDCSKRPLINESCRFGAWLTGQGRESYGALADFVVIESLHDEGHALARELVDMKIRGEDLQAIDRLSELYGLRDELVIRRRKLLWGPDLPDE